MSSKGGAVVMIVLVVLAGCAFPLDGGPSESPTPTPTPGVEQETPNATPTPNETSPYPPGVNETALENVSALLEAHTRALNQTGFVANGSGNTTIRRSGFLVDVSRTVRVVVANGSQRYFEVRRTQAGPVNRFVQRYSNGSVEFRRFAEDGDVKFRQREPQSAEKLSRVDHLDSFLRGGNFSVTEVREDDEPTTVLLRANRSDNETALLSGLPEDADRIRSYDATVVVDSAGRVRWLNASVGFVIGGNNKTHTVVFNLTRIGVTNVSRPDWLEEMNESDGGNGSDDSGDSEGSEGSDGGEGSDGDDESIGSEGNSSGSTDRYHRPLDRIGSAVGPAAHLGQRYRTLRRAGPTSRHPVRSGTRP